MLFKECFKIHIIEYHANQGNVTVFPKKSSYCKDHVIQGFVYQGPTVFIKFNLHSYWLAGISKITFFLLFFDTISTHAMKLKTFPFRKV